VKKRKVMPKERRTDYLDLTKPENEWSAADDAHLKRLVTALRKKKKIVVVAGAGISVSAGIPDFRSSTGLFAPAGSQQQKMKASGKHLFDASVYKHDASTQSFHTMVREMADMSQKAQPTPFHHLLASLAQEGRLLRLYSQNIDCIDTRMKPLATKVPLNSKGPWPTTIQLHGGLQKMVCTKCGQLDDFQGEIFDGPEAPLCEMCKEHDQVRTAHAGKRSHGIGRLRPRFVLYNEYNPDEEAIGNVSTADLKARPDAVLVVGTSLKVPGTRRLVKEMCQVTRGRRDGLTAFINIDSEPKGVEFKDCWDLVVRAKCDKVAREVALPPWDCSIGDDYLLSDNEVVQSELRFGETKVEVGIPSKSSSLSPSPTPEETQVETPAKAKQVEEAQAMPTPRPSPKLAAMGQQKQPGKKAKQIKLSFANNGAKAVAAADKPAKKPRASKPRKPRKTGAPAQPKATVANTFKAVKGVSEQPSSTKVSLLLPKVEVSEQTFSLRPERKASVESFTYICENPEAKKEDDGSSSVPQQEPTTPTMPERSASLDTISPKSVPRGMADLIDVK
jgi:NAD-dependent histone deacetylase SIR2